MNYLKLQMFQDLQADGGMITRDRIDTWCKGARAFADSFSVYKDGVQWVNDFRTKQDVFDLIEGVRLEAHEWLAENS